MRAVVIGFRHEHFGGAIQVFVTVRLARVNELLRRGDAVLFKHDDEHLGVDDRAGVEVSFYAQSLIHEWTLINTNLRHLQAVGGGA